MNHLQSGDRAARRALIPGVPRVLGGRGAAATVLGGATLVVIATVGASLVHLMEYHLGLGSASGRSAAEAMLAQCPIRGDLLALLLIVVTLVLAIANSVRVLSRRKNTLEHLARHAGLAANTIRVELPRSRARYVQILIPLFVTQAAVYAAFDRTWPMGPMMRMNGVFAHMAPQGALPIVPLHLLIAVALAAVVWRLERRIAVLRAIISAVQRFLARVVVPSRRVPRPALSVEINWHPAAGLLGLPRPPPCWATPR